MNKQPVICLLGPTATGKTALAEWLADRLPVGLISVDSMMIYRYLDIGTAKPSARELEAYPHALVDVCDPWETYSVAQFIEDVGQAIAAVVEDGRIPLLVGGTMMYFYHLQHGIHNFPRIDDEVRGSVREMCRDGGLSSLYEELIAEDPGYAAQLAANDQQRIMRAVEIIRQTGKPFSSFLQEADSGFSSPYHFLNLVLYAEDRDLLRQRIAARFQVMEKAGLWDEVLWCYRHPKIQCDMPAMKAVGYRQLWQVFTQAWSAEEARQRAVIATCQLAKRQRTWLNKWPEAFQLDIAQPMPHNELLNHIKRFAGAY